MKVTYEDHYGSDLKVVNMARVSFRKRKTAFDDKDERLIKYLAKHNHWAPFGHCGVTLHIKAPVAIRTQLFKHKIGFVESEVSRRYVDGKAELYVPTFRLKAENKKQGSGETHPNNKQLQENSYSPYMGMATFYTYLIEQGVAPEQARFFLPQGMYTEWYWTGTLVGFARMYKLRIAEDTQEETREIASQIGEIIEPLFPVSWKALVNDSNSV